MCLHKLNACRADDAYGFRKADSRAIVSYIAFQIRTSALTTSAVL